MCSYVFFSAVISIDFFYLILINLYQLVFVANGPNLMGKEIFVFNYSVHMLVHIFTIYTTFNRVFFYCCFIET